MYDVRERDESMFGFEGIINVTLFVINAIEVFLSLRSKLLNKKLKKIKKLLTNRKTHDNISELLLKHSNKEKCEIRSILLTMRKASCLGP